MKKWQFNLILTVNIFLLVIAVALVVVVKSDIYTKEQVDNLITENEQTIEERFLYEVMKEALFSTDFVFAEIGDTVNGTVEDYGYGYIVIECEQAKTIGLELQNVGTNWNLNLYYDLQMESSLEYDNVYDNQVLQLTLQQGFNIIEFDSYSNEIETYTVRIVEIAS